ncbi:hypothetical protein [Streptomyces sp. HNM0574]|uniref:hypothetical protein n=1 Tax=Streptomyces sp. HNM0574 TaxID=2714954 RepID=UPI00146EBA96|nr:hypothetical protein [Streptomyces sp. HNM0574]NLU66126.1 hypothetical protein [Streptomyces sp. HNM0574]
MTPALRTANLRPVLGRLLTATILCAAVAAPSAVIALDEATTSQRSANAPGSEWPAVAGLV